MLVGVVCVQRVGVGVAITREHHPCEGIGVGEHDPTVRSTNLRGGLAGGFTGVRGILVTGDQHQPPKYHRGGGDPASLHGPLASVRRG